MATSAGRLAEYLDAKRAAMAPFAEHASRYGVPRAVEPMQASAQVAGRSGIREVRIRQFRVLSDSGPDLAGFDLGPSSPELLLGSLASCLAHTWLIHAALERVTIDTLAVDVSAKMQSAAAAFPHPDLPAHPFELAYEARIGSGAEQTELVRLHDIVREHCPILALLTRAVPVDGTMTVTKPDLVADGATEGGA